MEGEVFVPVAAVVLNVEETPLLQPRAPNAADDALVLSSIGKMLREVELKPRRLVPPSIFRVREKIRSEDPEAYHPRLVSIGPFHRGNHSLLPMELVKHQFLSDLIGRHEGNTLHDYIKAVSTTSLLEEVSKCYSEPLAMDLNSLIEMMVLDGCFVVEYFIKYFLGEHMAELGLNSNRSLLIKDLLLLENQVPFWILQSLFDSSILPGLQFDNTPITFSELALMGIMEVREQPSFPIPAVCQHLLHLYHASLRPAPCSTSQEIANKLWTFRSVKRRIVNFVYMVLYRLLVRFSRTNFKPVRAPTVLRSATLLHRAGVCFTYNHMACFPAATFSIKEGTMEIPRVSINEFYVSKLRNLLEFEKSLSGTENHIASYVLLMYYLIDTPEDVRLLKRYRLLEIKLCEYEEVVSFFNVLNKEVRDFDYQNHHLAGLFKDVYEYWCTDSHRWRYLIMSSYFTKPWSLVSLTTVCFLIVLTFLQTFFAVYAYFRPP